MRPQTVGDAVAIYLLHTAREQGLRTLADRTHVLDALTHTHGSLALAEAKPWHLRLWLDANEAWKSDWTRKRACGTVQRVFNWACKLGIIDRNPFAGVSIPEGQAGRPMEPAEFQAMLRASSAVFRRVLIFLRFTGCRPCELAAFEWNFLDLPRSCFTLEKHKTARSRKDRRPRVVILHPVAIKLLAWIGRHAPHKQFAFTNARGTPWKRVALSLRVYRLRKRLGIATSCKLYGLRHAFGTRAILNATELKTLAELMGHTTTRMTERYVHIAGATDHLQAALRKALR